MYKYLQSTYTVYICTCTLVTLIDIKKEEYKDIHVYMIILVKCFIFHLKSINFEVLDEHFYVPAIIAITCLTKHSRMTQLD